MRQCTHCGSRFSNDARFCPYDGEPTRDATPRGADAFIGTILAGRYRIESILGEGGMGIVYRAVHVELDKRVAVKMLRADMANDETVAKRFVQEAKALSRIVHAHIVEVFDFGRTEDGLAYFVMEYLEGRSLREALRENDLSAREILRVARAMAEGLGAAHAAGIIHRDLKPDNVQLVQRDDDRCYVKILDFGVAKVAGVSRLTRNGAVFGTPHYMSPEQAQGHPVDHRSDIYSYGIILYELFTGRLPFDADTFVRVISQQIFEPPPPIELQPDRAELGAFAPIILRCLEKDVADRYGSFEEVSEALDELSSKRAPAWKSPRLLLPAAAAIALLAMLTVMALRKSDDGGASGFVDEPARSALIDQLTEGAEKREPSPRSRASFGEDDAEEDEPQLTPHFVLIDSDPQGAFVSLDGIGIGITPIQIPRPLSGERRLRIERDGRIPQEFVLASRGPERLVVHLPDRRAKPIREASAGPTKSRMAPQTGAVRNLREGGTDSGTQAARAAQSETQNKAAPSAARSTPETSAEPLPSAARTSPDPAPSEVVDPWGL